MVGMFRGGIAVMAAAASIAVGSTAYAADVANATSLEAGGQAGVKQALSWESSHQALYLLGGGAIIGGIILVATGNGHGSVTPVCSLPGCTSTTTTTTPPPTTTTTTKTSTSTTTSTRTH